MRKQIKAFTLVELLVVVGIIALLVSILLPALNKARAAAQAVQCSSNMKQLALAVTMYATDNNGWYPSNDCTLPNPNNAAAAKAFPWYTDDLVGKYVNNRTKRVGPDYVSTRVYFCPSVMYVVTSAQPGYWGAGNMGIGYNASNSIRNNYLYYRYPNVLASDPSYAAAEAGLAANNRLVARQGKIRQSAGFLLFTDVSGGTTSEASNKFIQMYNGCARTGVAIAGTPYQGTSPVYTTNPAGDAVSYRHGQNANVAFLDGHVSAYRSSMKDDLQPDTHKNTGIHAEILAGRITINAR